MKELLVGIVTIALVVVGSAIAQIEEVTTTEYGTQINFENGTGYWIEKEVK